MSTISSASGMLNAPRLGSVAEVEGDERAPADHRVAAAGHHLPPRELAGRMVPPGPDSGQVTTFWVPGKPVGEDRGRLALPPHSQIKGDQTIQQHPGVERRERRAGMADWVAVSLRECAPESQGSLPPHAALAVDVLGRRIDDDVGA